jgi:hypothetical protein
VPAAQPLERETTGPVGRLNPRIPAADKRRYEAVEAISAWRNPYLVIVADGAEVIAGRKTVASADLRQTLIDLPVNAWPHGRVVVVEENGLRTSDGSDTEPIRRNLEAALKILKALRIHVERWPSA